MIKFIPEVKVLTSIRYCKFCEAAQNFEKEDIEELCKKRMIQGVLRRILPCRRFYLFLIKDMCPVHQKACNCYIRRTYEGSGFIFAKKSLLRSSFKSH